MAKLIKCRECGHEISKRAKTCPNCGAPNKPKPMSALRGLVYIFVGATIFLMLVSGQNTIDKAKIRQAAKNQTTKTSTPNYNDKTKQFLWVENGKEAAAAKLKDSSSARFQNVFFKKSSLEGKTIPVVCGEINGKNSYGGYSGFQRFVSAGQTMTILQSDMEYNEFVKVWNQLCAG